MMQIDCPFCGRRDETEFSYGGEAHIARPGLDVDDERWVEYLFFRDNVKGVHAERWRHTRGCGQWFNAVRNTATHQFLWVYRITEPRPAMAPVPQLGSTAHPRAASDGRTPEARRGEVGQQSVSAPSVAITSASASATLPPAHGPATTPASQPAHEPFGTPTQPSHPSAARDPH